MLAISCSSGTTITLNLNGGSIDGATEFNVQLGDELNINDPVRDGYTFGGWLYIGEVVDLSSWSIDMKNVTLTAKWIASISNIYFDSDGGSEVLPITQEFESIVYEPVTPKKTGYTFLGWFKEGSDVPYKFNKMEKGDVYLKARWEITKFTIKFYTGGGSEVEEITLNYGEPVLKPQDPVREGYVFEGWYVDDEKFVFGNVLTGDITLKAKWTAVQVDEPTDSSSSDSTTSSGSSVSSDSNASSAGCGSVISELSCVLGLVVLAAGISVKRKNDRE
jgi:uncharacterized repeat protein (TIGR02543 family)